MYYKLIEPCQFQSMERRVQLSGMFLLEYSWIKYEAEAEIFRQKLNIVVWEEQQGKLSFNLYIK